MKAVILFTFLSLFAITCVKAEEEGLPSELLEKSYPRFGRDICSYQECDQLCRRIGRSGGVCVKNKCDCDIF